MKLGRRGLIAAAPAAGVAAPMIAKQVMNVAMNTRPESGLLASYGGEMARIGSGSPDPSYALWQKGYDAYRAAMKPHEEGDEVRASFRQAIGMDADLYALRSIPPQRKALMQFERDRQRAQERRTLHERIKATISKQFGIKNFNP